MQPPPPAPACTAACQTCSSPPAATLQVVGTAALAFAWWGFQFSWQFERGQKWDGYAPGLQQGALWGRRVVSAGRCRLPPLH